jgi:hypothetical protein
MVSLRDRTKLAKPKRLIDEIDNGPRKKQKGNTRPATSAAYPIVAAPVLLPADQDEALALEPAAAPNNYTAPTYETAPTSSAGSISPTSDNALLTGPHSGTSPRSPYLDPSSGPAAAPTIPPAPTCENASASSAGSISNPGDNPRGNPNGPPDGSQAAEGMMAAAALPAIKATDLLHLMILLAVLPPIHPILPLIQNPTPEDQTLAGTPSQQSSISEYSHSSTSNTPSSEFPPQHVPPMRCPPRTVGGSSILACKLYEEPTIMRSEDSQSNIPRDHGSIQQTS